MKKLICLICIFLLGNAYIYSHNYLENQNLLQLYQSNDSSLIGQEGNKFYLNPDRVSISQSGMIYLHSDLYGNLPIPFLSYDNHGLHTMAFCVYICNNCGASYSSQPSSCTRVINHKTGERCGGTSFTVTGMLPD